MRTNQTPPMAAHKSAAWSRWSTSELAPQLEITYWARIALADRA